MDMDDDEVEVLDEGRQPRGKHHWKTFEEKLPVECWVAVFENNETGSDRSNQSFLQQVTKNFNKYSNVQRTKDMMTGKCATLNDNI